VSEDSPYLDYAVRWRVGQSFPGRHAAQAQGVGGFFSAYRPFWQVPDARRIDVRRSLADPFGDLVVRQTDSKSAISVIVVADLSRSMKAAPAATGLNAVALLAEAAARSARKSGDAFGFIGFDEVVQQNFVLPASRGRTLSDEFLTRLRALGPAGRSSAGLLAVEPLLPRQKSLILLVSDFLMPFDVLKAGLEALTRHDVAPVVLHEARERTLPPNGLVRLLDAESGQKRLVLMRPAMRRAWEDARQKWRRELDAVFVRWGRPAFHAEGRLDVAALGAHLMSV
jgi:uncharacterized protein (DUF58 family)